jgi:hypothetical protein
MHLLAGYGSLWMCGGCLLLCLRTCFERQIRDWIFLDVILFINFQVKGTGNALAQSAVLPAPYKGIADVCTRVIKESGIRGLYRGLCKWVCICLHIYGWRWHDLQPLPYRRQGYNFDTLGLTQVLIFFCVCFWYWSSAGFKFLVKPGTLCAGWMWDTEDCFLQTSGFSKTNPKMLLLACRSNSLWNSPTCWTEVLCIWNT